MIKQLNLLLKKALFWVKKEAKIAEKNTVTLNPPLGGVYRGLFCTLSRYTFSPENLSI